MKKLVSIAVIVLMLASLMLSGALAQGGMAQGGGMSPGGNQNSNGGGQARPQQSQGGDRPQAGDSQVATTAGDSQSSTGDTQSTAGNTPPDNHGQRDDQNPGINTDQVEAAIADLTDTDAATEITELLAAYETAASGSDTDATQTALKALLDAMADANVKVSEDGKGKAVSTDQLEDAIATLTDTDTAATLSALLATYEDAAAGDDETAAQAALQALLTAMQAAGLTTDNGRQNPDGQKVNTDQLEDAIATLTDTDTAATLSALLETYEDAAAGDDETVTQAALQALLTAMQAAGLTTDNGRQNPDGQKINTDQIEDAIATLTDTDTAATLSALLATYEDAAAGDDETVTQEALQALLTAMKAAGLATDNGFNPDGKPTGKEYGRFLDTEKVAVAIAKLSDTDTATTLTTLLSTYKTAVASGDDTATQAALQALLDAMAQADLKVESGKDHGNPFNAAKGKYLDIDQIADAIDTLTDTDVATALTTLLATYQSAVAAGDDEATQTAFTALLDAMEDAGLQTTVVG